MGFRMILLFLASFSSLSVLSLSGLSASAHAAPPNPAASAPLGAINIKLPVPEIETLPNGLQIVWFLSDRLPVVDLALLVKSGFRDDPAGKTGTSELLAAALDRGSAGLSAEQIARQVDRLGASHYVLDEEETFSIGMHGLAPDADVLLELLSKIALQPDFKPEEVEREKARLLDRWNHLGDYSEELASLAYRRAITSGTPYARGNFESIAEFKRVGRADAMGFYKKHFIPSNSILMIVGRVERKGFHDRIVQLFGQPLGGWKGDARVPRPSTGKFVDSRLRHSRGQILIVDRPDLSQAQVRLGFRAPLIGAPDHYALTVANALLGEYFNSRLNALIRDKLGLTYGIGSSFTYSQDLATLTITSSTRNESVGELVSKTLGVLKEMKKAPIPDDEVQMAKEYLVGRFPLSTSTLDAVASRWMTGYIFDRGAGYLNEFVPKISAVTAAEVSSAVKAHFDPEDLLIVVAGDSAAIAASLKESGLKSYRKITLKDLM